MVSGETTQYIDGFQYKGGVLQFVPTAEGYYDFTQQRYVYNLKDHLGNNRVSFYQNPNTQQLEILNESHYYPFGMEQDNPRFAKNDEKYKYKYNAKELQDELGLNWTSMDYRNYDMALGRYMSPDALSELAPMHTTYRFGFNNPVYWRDPTGLFEYDDNGNIKGTTREEVAFLLDYVQSGGNLNSDDLFGLMVEQGFSIELGEVSAMGTKSNDSGSDIGGSIALATGGYGGDKLSNVKGYLNFRDIPINNPGPKYRNAYTNIRYKPDARGLHFMKGTTVKISNLGYIMKNGSIGLSAILEVSDVLDGYERDGNNIGKETVKETVGGVAGVLGGVWAGAKGGALGGAISSKNPYGIAIGTVFGGVFGGIAGEQTAENVTDFIINNKAVNESQLSENRIIKPMP